jgi:hypothetical protein
MQAHVQDLQDRIAPHPQQRSTIYGALHKLQQQHASALLSPRYGSSAAPTSSMPSHPFQALSGTVYSKVMGSRARTSRASFKKLSRGASNDIINRARKVLKESHDVLNRRMSFDSSDCSTPRESARGSKPVDCTSPARSLPEQLMDTFTSDGTTDAYLENTFPDGIPSPNLVWPFPSFRPSAPDPMHCNTQRVAAF